MSDNPTKPPEDPSASKERFRVVREDDSVTAGLPDEEQRRQLFMASEHVEWTPFAKQMGWNPVNSAQRMPTSDWSKQKRDILAREQAETIGELVFNHRSRWHQDVLQTLKDHPAAHDAMLNILKRRMNDIIQTINQDDRAAAHAAAANVEAPAPRFAQIKSSELATLTVALNDWSFKVAESFSDPKQFGTEQEKIKNMEWNVRIIGGENVTRTQMQELLSKYYDRPAMPHTPEQIDKVSGGDDGEG